MSRSVSSICASPRPICTCNVRLPVVTAKPALGAFSDGIEAANLGRLVPSCRQLVGRQRSHSSMCPWGRVCRVAQTVSRASCRGCRPRWDGRPVVSPLVSLAAPRRSSRRPPPACPASRASGCLWRSRCSRDSSCLTAGLAPKIPPRVKRRSRSASWVARERVGVGKGRCADSQDRFLWVTPRARRHASQPLRVMQRAIAQRVVDAQAG